MKNPTLATIFNIVPGIGYLYVGGKKRIFGVLLLLTIVVTIAAMFDPLLAVDPNDPYLNVGPRWWDLLTLAGILLPIAAFMYDGYQSAMVHNAALMPSKASKK